MISTDERTRPTSIGLLQDKVIVVTGAGSGIGASSARLFGREGATVVLADLAEDQLEKVTASVVEAGGNADWVRADVGSPQDVERVINGLLERHGRLDGAFNNAGVSQAGPFSATSTPTASTSFCRSM